MLFFVCVTVYFLLLDINLLNKAEDCKCQSSSVKLTKTCFQKYLVDCSSIKCYLIFVTFQMSHTCILYYRQYFGLFINRLIPFISAENKKVPVKNIHTKQNKRFQVTVYCSDTNSNFFKLVFMYIQERCICLFVMHSNICFNQNTKTNIQVFILLKTVTENKVDLIISAVQSVQSVLQLLDRRHYCSVKFCSL